MSAHDAMKLSTRDTTMLAEAERKLTQDDNPHGCKEPALQMQQGHRETHEHGRLLAGPHLGRAQALAGRVVAWEDWNGGPALVDDLDGDILELKSYEVQQLLNVTLGRLMQGVWPHQLVAVCVCESCQDRLHNHKGLSAQGATRHNATG